MLAVINAHRTVLGLILLLLTTTLGLAFLFDWRIGGPSVPSDATPVLPLSPPATMATLASPPAPSSPAPTATAALAQLKVYISGAVAQPGVYAVNGAARVGDVLAAAGGPAPDADLDRINLAARIQDEEQIIVPRLGTPGVPVPALPAAAQATAPPATGGSAPPAGPININTADAAALETLPGIGPVLAARIVDYRTEHGPFARVEALQDVPGIGAKIFASLKAHITVGP